MVALNSTFYFGAYFTEQYKLYFTLAFSITFYVDAYFTEQYSLLLSTTILCVENCMLFTGGFYMLISTFYYFQ